MTASRKPGLLLPAAIVIVLALVGASVVRRALPRAHAASPGAPAETAAAMGGRSEPVADSAPLADSARADAARHELVRRRIQEESAGTYLAETLNETDSMLRRWPDDRIDRPLRVAVLRQDVNGFREEFVSNVAWAVGRWNGVVPVGLTTGADSASADIVITWTVRMDSGRTGRTDLTWDRRGRIHQAFIVLATHTPEGQALDARRMSALALHEVGHALGLGHSRRREDALYPVTLAQELSERDRRTARLLYDLPPGSIR